MLEIFGKASSINVRKVLWTCGEIDISYKREDWGSGFKPTNAPDFLAMNPNGLVPVIKDETGILWESNTICRYLATKHVRTDLLPTAAKERAVVEQWMDWQATELNASWRYVFLGIVRQQPQYQDLEQIAASAAAWNENMGILERHLSTSGDYVTGDAFTLADIVLGLSVHRWLMTPVEKPVYPAVRKYYERLKRRPAFLGHTNPAIP